MRSFKLICASLLLTAGLTLANAAQAQSIFSPVVTVNDSIITEFEIEQRERFLTLLNAPGATREAVVESLIEERLRAQAVREAGLTPDQGQIDAGIEDFAGRVNLTGEEFILVLEENGVARETLESFVTVGVAWRDFIRARFAARLEITESDIDEALGTGGGGSRIRVLLSEVIIPIPRGRAEEVQELAAEIALSQSEEEFSEYARQYSGTATRDDGGRLPWRALNELPEILRPLLLNLAPGEVTEPIPIPDAIALFQLRGIEETGVLSESFSAIDFAQYFIPGGRTPEALAQAERIRSTVDVCNDLYGIAQGQPPEILIRETLPPAEIPTDIALELSKLDPGESSVALTRSGGQTLVFLMLCNRTTVANEEVDRAAVEQTLRSARLTAIAESYLDQLKSDARIILQ
ncbi:MAG: peptidylprolyl isomerase [Pseudomonadota bacterium]